MHNYTYVDINGSGLPVSIERFVSQNKYTYFEPRSAFSVEQLAYLEQLKTYGAIPNFDVENTFIYAPTRDQIYGREFIENGSIKSINSSSVNGTPISFTNFRATMNNSVLTPITISIPESMIGCLVTLIGSRISIPIEGVIIKYAGANIIYVENGVNATNGTYSIISTTFFSPTTPATDLISPYSTNNTISENKIQFIGGTEYSLSAISESTGDSLVNIGAPYYLNSNGEIIHSLNTPFIAYQRPGFDIFIGKVISGVLYLPTQLDPINYPVWITGAGLDKHIATIASSLTQYSTTVTTSTTNDGSSQVTISAADPKILIGSTVTSTNGIIEPGTKVISISGTTIGLSQKVFMSNGNNISFAYTTISSTQITELPNGSHKFIVNRALNFLEEGVKYKIIKVEDGDFFNLVGAQNINEGTEFVATNVSGNLPTGSVTAGSNIITFSEEPAGLIIGVEIVAPLVFNQRTFVTEILGKTVKVSTNALISTLNIPTSFQRYCWSNGSILEKISREVLRPSQFVNPASQLIVDSNLSGKDSTAKFGVTIYNGRYQVELDPTSIGTNYKNGDILNIPGYLLGGTSPVNDLTFTISTQINRKVWEPEYWKNLGYISSDSSGEQVGFIPSLYSKNSLDPSELKVSTDRLVVPTFLPVLISIREVVGRSKVRWKLVDITKKDQPEEIIQVEAGWTFIWRFPNSGEFQLSATVIDIRDNEHPLPETNFIRVMEKAEYIEYIENALSDRLPEATPAPTTITINNQVLNTSVDDFILLNDGKIINKTDGSAITLTNL